ncbi:MAG: hypothetical protein JOZ43_01880 [Acidobacteriales bacterium]|nr:hypothetical protein [Terriglobales bacterium]
MSPSSILLRGTLLTLLFVFTATLAAQLETNSITQVTRQLPTTLCAPPPQAGVRVCAPSYGNVPGSPVAVGTPFQFIASATGAHGPVNHIELWIDGHKNRQISGNLIDQTVALPLGTHRIVAFEVDSTGAHLNSVPFDLTIQSDSTGTPCAPPSTPGVNVCNPQPNSCTTTPWYPVVAAGTGASGSVNHMELWINGNKIADIPGAYMNTNVTAGGFDTVTVIEVDDLGAFIKSAPIVFPVC